MGTTSAITIDSPLFWVTNALIMVLVAVLTYIYSNKDLRLTLVFTLLASIGILCAEGYETWDRYLQDHFLVALDPLSIPYRASRSGWYIFIDIWPFWVFPSSLLLIVWGALQWRVQHWLVAKSKALPKPQEPTTKPVVAQRQTSEAVVALQLELDSVKKALLTANERLTKGLVEKEQIEQRLRELKTKLKGYERGELGTAAQLEERIQALQLANDAKTQHAEQLIQENTQHQQEIARLKALIKRLS